MNSKRSLSLFAILLLSGIPGLTAEELPRKGTASRVIYLNMLGGMSQWETLDPKPGNGPSGVAASENSDIVISGWLPKTAGLLHHCFIIRNLGGTISHVSDHTQYMRLTGYDRRSTITHPDIGAWIKYLLPRSGPYVKINPGIPTGAGFFPAERCSPVMLPSPGSALTIDGEVDLWKARKRLQVALHRHSPIRLPEGAGDSLASTRFFASGKNRSSLEWSSEPEEIQQRYGNHDFGRSCLLARRLVETADAVFVEVGLPGWDAEGENFFAETKRLCSQLDDGFSALLTDLAERDLLDSTLVVIATDYGRRAAIHKGYRDFSSQNSSALLAGGGIAGGEVFGETAPANGRPLSGVLPAQQFNAVIARALNLNPFETVYSPSRRPFTIGDRRNKSGIFEVVFGPD